MNRETAKPGPTRPPPKRSSTAPCRLSVCFLHLATLVLFAHLLVVTHTALHFPDSPVEDAFRHCAICSAGGHSAGVPAAMPAAPAQTVTWMTEPGGPQSPPTRFPGGASFARAPPLAPPLAPPIVTIV